jgi:hypothetical protein
MTLSPVAGDYYVEVFEFPVRKAFKKRFDALLDLNTHCSWHQGTQKL